MLFCGIQNGCQGLKEVVPLGFWSVHVKFRQISLLIWSFLPFLKNPKWPPEGAKIAAGVWRGVYPQVLGRSRQVFRWKNSFYEKSRRRRKKERKEKKIMTFIVATNVIASRPPERRPTGTPHARANWKYLSCVKQYQDTLYVLMYSNNKRGSLENRSLGKYKTE